MAASPRGFFGWSWWPPRRLAWLVLVSLVALLFLDFFAFRSSALASFLAMIIAAPYAVVFLAGFPSPAPRSRRR